MARMTVYAPSPDLVIRKVGDEAILVPIRNQVGDLDSVFTLNEVALRVWKLLDGQRDAAGIAEIIAGEFEVEPAVATADIDELLAALEAAHLVEPVRSAD